MIKILFFSGLHGIIYIHMEKILVIGASNIDFLAFPKGKLRMRDSNIGSVDFAFGGVGRNIAENLARLGNDVSFISAFGEDVFGEMLKKNLSSLGIDLKGSVASGKRSGMYVAIANQEGELVCAICENEIVTEIDREHLARNLDYINSFSHLFLDANLSPEALDFLFRNATGKVYIDATSVAKSGLFKPYLSRITLLKGNRAEICSLGESDDLEEGMKNLIASGVTLVAATDGAASVRFNHGREILSIPVPPARVASTNGAGDAFLSGVIHGLLNGKTFSEGIVYGIKAAQATLLVPGACNPDLVKYL